MAGQPVHPPGSSSLMRRLPGPVPPPPLHRSAGSAAAVALILPQSARTSSAGGPSSSGRIPFAPSSATAAAATAAPRPYFLQRQPQRSLSGSNGIGGSGGGGVSWGAPPLKVASDASTTQKNRPDKRLSTLLAEAAVTKQRQDAAHRQHPVPQLLQHHRALHHPPKAFPIASSRLTNVQQLQAGRAAPSSPTFSTASRLLPRPAPTPAPSPPPPMTGGTPLTPPRSGIPSSPAASVASWQPPQSAPMPATLSPPQSRIPSSPATSSAAPRPMPRVAPMPASLSPPSRSGIPSSVFSAGLPPLSLGTAAGSRSPMSSQDSVDEALHIAAGARLFSPQ